ncbi:MAG: hypothetical protein KatS3mg054_0162 [Chloroflexus sp.]|nr:MAG: hypothetical protein KatS3mg054_0162 [Chloroflexus sp.]
MAKKKGHKTRTSPADAGRLRVILTPEEVAAVRRAMAARLSPDEIVRRARRASRVPQWKRDVRRAEARAARRAAQGLWRLVKGLREAAKAAMAASREAKAARHRPPTGGGRPPKRAQGPALVRILSAEDLAEMFRPGRVPSDFAARVNTYEARVREEAARAARRLAAAERLARMAEAVSSAARRAVELALAFRATSGGQPPKA